MCPIRSKKTEDLQHNCQQLLPHEELSAAAPQTFSYLFFPHFSYALSQARLVIYVKSPLKKSFLSTTSPLFSMQTYPLKQQRQRCHGCCCQFTPSPEVAAKLLPENSPCLLKPGRLNIEPIQVSLKSATTIVKELFLWHMSLQQQEKRMGSHRSCQRVELSKAGTCTATATCWCTHTPLWTCRQHTVPFYQNAQDTPLYRNKRVEGLRI